VFLRITAGALILWIVIFLLGLLGGDAWR